MQEDNKIPTQLIKSILSPDLEINSVSSQDSQDGTTVNCTLIGSESEPVDIGWNVDGQFMSGSSDIHIGTGNFQRRGVFLIMRRWYHMMNSMDSISPVIEQIN